MNDIDYQQVIKWVLIVIVAGFLGQFGKSFAVYLIERARKKKISDASESRENSFKQPEESTPPVTMSETTRTETEAKAKKKALKALIKLRKKEE